MRNAEDLRYEKMLDVLKETGITPNNMRIAEAYLEDGDEQRLSGVEHQELDQFGKEQADICRIFMEKVAKRNDDLNVRFVHFLFAVGHQSAGSLFEDELTGWRYTVKLADAKVFDYLPRAKALASFAGAHAEDSIGFTYQISFVGEYVKAGMQEEEILKEAITYCDVGYINAEVILSIAYLIAKKQKNGRLSKEDQQMLKEIFEGAVENIPAIFGVQEGSTEHQVLKDYFVQEPETAKPLPDKVKAVLDKCTVDEYLLVLLVVLPNNFCMEYHWFDNMTRAGMYKKQDVMLEAACSNAHIKNRNQVVMRMKEIGNVSDKEFLMWSLKEYHNPLLEKMFEINREAFYEVFEGTNFEQGEKMIEVIKLHDSKRYEEMVNGDNPEYLKRMQRGIVQCISASENEETKPVKDFLYGKADIPALHSAMEKLQGKFKCQIQALKNAVKAYYNRNGLDDFLNRVNTVMVLYGSEYYFGLFLIEYRAKANQVLTEMIAGIAETGLEPEYILDLLGKIRNLYMGNSVEASFTAMKNYLQREMAEQHERIVEALVNGSAAVRCMAVEYLCEEKENGSSSGEQEQWMADLSRFFEDSAKAVKEKIVEKFGSVSECREFLCEQLASKKLARRQMAAAVIEKAGSREFDTELEALLQKEKNEKLASKVRSMLGIEGEKEAGSEGADILTPEAFVEQLHKGNRKRSLEWLFAKEFAPVHKSDGTIADDRFLQAVLLCYSSMGVPGMNKEAGILTNLLKQEELEVFAAEVFDRWIEDGAKAKQKWVLYFSSIHGGKTVADRLKRQIQEWPKQSRGAIAAEAVRALALNPEPTALMTVDGISRKFKFRQVKEAAGEAMEFAAKELGISAEELSDRIVPTLGFDANMEQMFDYGGRSFRVALNNSLELSVYDGKGKQLKNLPAPGKNDDAIQAEKANKAFKEMKKQLKAVVSNQRARLEQALSSERKWTKEAWQKLFVENPVMHCFAMGLIWGTYEEQKLETPFRYMEDGTFNTVDEEEFELPENALIGLIHPSELEKDAIDAWKEQLSDYEVTQPFEQLERAVYTYEEKEADQCEISRFEGLVINGLSLLGKMTGFGWYKGAVEDAGFYYSFYREDEALGIGAELTFEGVQVGDENEDTTIGKLAFYKTGTVGKGGYVYHSAEKENAVAVKDLPERYFSEIIYQVKKTLAGAREE